MKQAIFFAGIIIMTLNGYSQTDTTKRISKTKSVPASTINRSAKLGIQPKNAAAAQLPDLKFTSFNVTASAPYVVNGIINYTLNVSYTVKNDGAASVSYEDIVIQGFLTNEHWIQQTQDPKFTGMFTAVGGGQLSGLKGQTLAPGDSKQVSYYISNKELAKDPKPVLLLIINYLRGPQEITRDNNNAYMTILL